MSSSGYLKALEHRNSTPRPKIFGRPKKILSSCSFVANAKRRNLRILDWIKSFRKNSYCLYFRLRKLFHYSKSLWEGPNSKKHRLATLKEAITCLIVWTLFREALSTSASQQDYQPASERHGLSVRGPAYLLRGLASLWEHLPLHERYWLSVSRNSSLWEVIYLGLSVALPFCKRLSLSVKGLAFLWKAWLFCEKLGLTLASHWNLGLSQIGYITEYV